MPEIPAGAVQAGAEVLAAFYGDENLSLTASSFEGEARAVVAAVAPLLLSQGRAEEGARIAEDLRQLGDWPDSYRRFREFIEHNGLVEPSERPLFSAFLLAFSDMVRRGDDA